MKKVGVIITPLARALLSSASTRAWARRAASSASSGSSRARPRSLATALRSSSVSVSERVINSIWACQNLSGSSARSASSAARRAISLPGIGRCRKT
jgi:hypothetical protein